MVLRKQQDLEEGSGQAGGEREIQDDYWSSALSKKGLLNEMRRSRGEHLGSAEGTLCLTCF